MLLKAHVICHTHWDREWYLTREQFRTKLIRLIDGLLDMVDNNPQYVSFMLDGQTIAIEDYLEIKPYNKERLYAALRTGKIISGPWYILPDELLISGESHIRNYIMGTKVIKEVGLKMKTAYLPDSFGHPCQMPQIIEGLGMDTMVFWRGVNRSVTHSEFYWESPYSDSKILCVHMPHGYGNSGNLSEDIEKTSQRMEFLLGSLAMKSTTNVVLLMNGSDHITGQENITNIITQLNKNHPQYDMELSTLETFIKELKSNLKDLPTHKGEFRSGEKSMLLGGTISTRMEIKQNNNVVEQNMERYLEPILAGEKLLGGREDIRGYSDYIWRKILENQPHDSICGCSIDEVHKEMMTRFECLKQLEENLITDALGRVALLSSSKEADKTVQLHLFEPGKDMISSYMEADIYMDPLLVQKVNFTTSTIENYEKDLIHKDMPKGIRITDEIGRIIPYVMLETRKEYDTLYQDHTLPEIYQCNYLKVGLLLPGFTYGFHKLTVEQSKEKGAWIQEISDNMIENEYYRISFEESSFQVTDKKSGKILKKVGKFIDKGDAGDEYTYSWPKEDTIYSEIQEIHIIKELKGVLGESLIVTGYLVLPKELEENRIRRSKECIKSPITIKVSLYQNIDRIDFWTKFENYSKDHRLQVQFPSGIKTDYSESYDIFNITKRDVLVKVPKQWVEYPQNTHPSHGFMNLEDGTFGICASTNGLLEFEAVQEKSQTMLHITLLRCVGWLSRTDLLSRIGNGGWTIETKDAQCLNSYIFEYSICYHQGSFRSSNCFGVMEKAKLPSFIRRIQNKEHRKVNIANSLEFLSSLPKEIRISAVKVSEDEKAIVVRLFSIGTKIQEAVLQIPMRVKRIEYCNLIEEEISQIKMEDHKLIFQLKPSQIVTLKLIMEVSP